MKKHLRSQETPDKSIHFPHKFSSLTQGGYAACGNAGCVGPANVTDDPAEVTCIPCKELIRINVG